MMDGTCPTPKRHRRGTSRARAILVPLLKAAVSIALLALLFSKVDVARLWIVARTASVPWLRRGAGPLPRR